MNERMRFVNPLKMREYLSAGLPVVSTAVPEVMCYAHACRVAHSPEEFTAAVEAALGDDARAARTARSEAMNAETWAARVAEGARVIGQIAAEKRRRGAGARS